MNGGSSRPDSGMKMAWVNGGSSLAPPMIGGKSNGSVTTSEVIHLQDDTPAKTSMANGSIKSSHKSPEKTPIKSSPVKSKVEVVINSASDKMISNGNGVIGNGQVSVEPQHQLQQQQPPAVVVG